jgi:hypothetical protein
MLQRLNEEIDDCLARAAEARRRAEAARDPQVQDDYRRQEQSWDRLAQCYRFAASLDRFLPGIGADAEGWQPAASAPFDQQLELAVIDRHGTHALVFACRRDPEGWIDAQTGRRIEVVPTHWREWMDLRPAGDQARREAGAEAGLVVFADERVDLRIERGERGTFELVLRIAGEELTAYDLDRDTIATIGRRLLSLAARA